MKKAAPKVLIVTGYGVNCEAESARAWELAGGQTTLIHFNDLLASPRSLEKHQALMFIGGFSFGDHMGSGHVMASRWRHCLREPLRKLLKQGGLALGVCNGFQVMVKLGLLPGPDRPDFVPSGALIHNTSGVFQNFWVTLKFDPASKCIFTRGLETMDMPIRHAEGRFYTPDRRLLADLEQRHCIPCRYVEPRSGRTTMKFPHNPNGSLNAIAGLCAPSGRVFGLMPHPEAFLFPENHPQWQRRKLAGKLPEHGDGLMLFKNAVDFLQKC